MKKTINSILILAVLGLWGTVIYKAAHQYLFPNESVVKSSVSGAGLSMQYKSKDTFKIQDLTRDPFLNRSVGVRPAPSFRQKRVIKNSVVKPKPVPLKWPKVAYYGYIVSGEKKNELFLIKVDGKLYKIRNKESAGGVAISKIYKDSIAVVFNKESKVIALQK